MENVNYCPKLLPKLVERQFLANAPFMLFDIGCAGGIDPAWRLFGAHLHAHGFDPQEDECARLTQSEENRNIQYHAAYLGLPEGHPFHAERASRQPPQGPTFGSYFVRSSTIGRSSEPSAIQSP